MRLPLFVLFLFLEVRCQVGKCAAGDETCQASLVYGSFADKVGRLQNWLEGLGGFVNPGVGAAEHSEVLASEGSDRGLVALKPLEKNERLVFVPHAALVSHPLAVSDHLGQHVEEMLVAERERCVECPTLDTECRKTCKVISEASDEALQQVAIAAFLARELRNASSMYKPWLDMLPNCSTGSLLTMDPKHLKVALQGTELLEEVTNLQEAWKLAHQVLSKSELYRSHVPDFETFANARLVVLSRTHGLSYSGLQGATSDALVPYADLLNHEIDAPTFWKYDVALQGFVLSAARPIQKGSPITCSYGSKRSNKELFLHYGFVIPKNPAHSVPVMVGLDRSRTDPLYAAKREAILSMDFYRVFRFGVHDCFAASGVPLRVTTGQEKGSSRDDDADPVLKFYRDAANKTAAPTCRDDSVMFGEVLAYVRIAALTIEDLEASSLLNKAFLEQDMESVEALRDRRMVLSPDLEGRAAARLKSNCQEALDKMPSSKDAMEDSLMERLENAGYKDSGLQHVASTASQYLALDRELYSMMHDVALTVETLVKKGKWPVGAENKKDLDELGLSQDVAEHVTRWVHNYRAGEAKAKKKSEL